LVLVDVPTQRLTGSAIAFADAGEHTLKGKAEPQRLWRAVRVLSAVGGSQRVDGLEAPLTGRDAELRAIRDLFHAAAERRVPRLVLVSGPAGVGKSRLGWEFEKYTDGLAQDVWWHRGRCLSYGEGVAFWALAEIVRQRLGIAEEVSDISLSCRQVGPIQFKNKFAQGEEMYRRRRSIVFKKMQIVRGCDTKRNVLVYVVYSDKLIEGSPKNSTSSVPIMPWGSSEPPPKCADWLEK
jgi:hypothetical protein